nr:response regulator [uncultured Kingella sp.]
MPHILILEDEAEIAEIIAIALARDCHSSQIAPTAQAASQHLAREAYDLLLLDVGLPDINGFDYLKILRAQHPRLPVIMLTAQDEETDRILGLELGADDYIGKPFSPRELNARIKALLRRSSLAQRQPENERNELQRSQNAHSPAPAVSQWQDDTQAHCIRHQGQALPLTLGEYRLLRTLIAHPQRVYSREELLSAMFGSNHPSDPHTINTHIRALRQKLRAAQIDPACIHTHHGIGYSFQ